MRTSSENKITKYFFFMFGALLYCKFTIEISGDKTKRQLWHHFLENYRVSNKD